MFKQIVCSLLLTCNLSNAFLSGLFSPPKVTKSPINCVETIRNLLENDYDKPLGDQWNLVNLREQSTKQSIQCAVLYPQTTPISMIIIDTHYDMNPESINLHEYQMVPTMVNTVVEECKLRNIPLNIMEYKPTPYSFYILVSVILKYSFFLFWYLTVLSIIMQMYTTIRQYKRGSSRFEVHLPDKSVDAECDNTETGYFTKKTSKSQHKVHFSDIAGCDEAKNELTEVIDFIKYPSKYSRAGAKIPTGVLLEGPPGTGKTMLAKACANEAGVSFLSATGSQFVEMYVGVGASRVRDLFELAQKSKPCIVFIDEIDSIGQQRGYDSNSERDQTLNQLLTNMDGFDQNDGIIVIGATNRADMLDNALTRPGRFDRKVTVGLPDKEGREQILKVHMKNKRVSSNADLNSIYELTGGFSGAQLSNLVNEAAILSVRYKNSTITGNCLVDAFEKITIGLPKKTDNRPKDNVRMVAYHESGHAIIALIFEEMFDVRRVTINANNTGAGGYTLFTPNESYSQFPSKRFMLANIMISLGGRVAEVLLYKKETHKRYNYDDNIIFDGVDDLDITVGASNDLQQANKLARKYIGELGLGQHIGLYDTDSSGRSCGKNKISEKTKYKIDKEVEEIVDNAFEQVLLLMKRNWNTVDTMVEMLLDKITINGEDIQTILRDAPLEKN